MFRFTGTEIRVRGSDELALKRWAKILGVSEDEIKKALIEVGTREILKSLKNTAGNR